MYFSENTIKESIEALSKVSPAFTGKNGNIDLFSFFLILKRLELRIDKWVTKTQLYNDQNSTLSAIYDCGGVFDNNEEVGFRGCLFFTSFSKYQTIKESDFFNQKTKFKSLPSRLKDTVDNSIADYIIDKGMNDSYRLNMNYLDILKSNYATKFPMVPLLIWIYRSTNMEGISFSSLKYDFANRYNLSETEIFKLLDTNTKVSITYSDQQTSSAEIRSILGINSFTQIEKTGIVDPNYKIKLNNKELMNAMNNSTVTSEEVSKVLNDYKQVVLTGVPGTGKSHMIDIIGKDFKKVKKIQFHQNYTYQQFILGKTIKDSSVTYENGDLTEFALEAISHPEDNYLLFIDEINRGNISSIFGETLYLLDRGNNITLPNKVELSLPNNLFIMGTMNTSDRSIAIVDFAIRRRFMFLELKPNYFYLDEHYKLDGEELLGDFLQKINMRITEYFNNEDNILGHSYFMQKKNMTSDDMYVVLHYKIIPMIVEYGNGDKTILDSIFGDKILKSNTESLLESVKEYIND